jgi:hypothetical protein
MRSLKVFAVVGLAVFTLSGYSLAVFATPKLEYKTEVVGSDGNTYLQYEASDQEHGLDEILSFDNTNPNRPRPEKIMYHSPNFGASTDAIKLNCHKEWIFYIRKDHAEQHNHRIQIRGCPAEAEDYQSFELPATNPKKPTLLSVEPITVPSTTEWGLIVLAVLLAGSLAFMIRRRLAPRPAGA